jgi:phage tail sheath protein FI
MPEYLAPGVYVVEVEGTAKPIEGIPASIADRIMRALAHDLRKHLVAFAPDWTDHNESDPGVTLVALFAWLAEQSLYRMEALPDRAIAPASRLTALLLALLADTKAQHCHPLKPVRFYPKRHLTEFTP